MISFRPAVRTSVGLLIGVIGASGSGKTFSALRVATGLAGGKRFAMIDTEAGRGLHYADQFAFDHGDLKPPFRPHAYTEAIHAADGAGYPVIIVDSVSHEHAGDGGLLDWQEEELTRMAGDDWKKREAVKMAAWVKPKMAHKRMMQEILQVRAHLILCFRAEEKIEMVRGQDGKMVIQPKRSLTGLSGWIPVCEKTVPYELTASFLLTPEDPGMPKPIKLNEQHRAFVNLDQPLNEQTGESLAAWARGGAPPITLPVDARAASPAPPTAPSPEAAIRAGRGPIESSPLADLWTRVLDACGGHQHQRLAVGLIKAVSKELGREVAGLSELTSAELAKFVAVPDETLAHVAAGLKK